MINKNIMYQKYISWICIIAILKLHMALGIPKYSSESKNYEANKQWNRAYYNENKTQIEEAASTKDRLQRLGYTTGYGTLNGGYGTGLSAYNPIKLDLGGVVLGTLVGIGAIILIPKILQAFHGGYGGYARSEDNEVSTLTTMMNKIDDMLNQNNIDSTSCLQRAVCSYMRTTEGRRRTGTSDQMDELIHSMAGNSLMDYFLEGTAIKEALERGKKMNDKTCEEIYTSCPLNSTLTKTVSDALFPQQSSNPGNNK